VSQTSVLENAFLNGTRRRLNMISTLQVFLAARLLGETSHYCAGFSDGGKSYSGFWPHVAFFCTECGELWGRRFYQHPPSYSPLPSAKWVVQERRCRECGDGELLAAGMEEAASPELLKYEFEVLLTKAEKGLI